MLSIDVFDRSGASRVDRDQLLAFERIVRVGSFSRAAGELGIAQGTISARIRVLEQEVGGELFSDAMGEPGTYRGTYIGMIDHNVTTIVRALGGQAPERGFQDRLGVGDFRRRRRRG